MVFENPSWSTFVSEITKFEKAKYDGYMFGWGIVTAEPDQMMGEHFYSVNARRTLYNNPEVDRLIVDARENLRRGEGTVRLPEGPGDPLGRLPLDLALRAAGHHGDQQEAEAGSPAGATST